MANIISKIGGRVLTGLGRVFGNKTKTTITRQPTLVQGNRGVAWGDLSDKDLSAENAAKWQGIRPEDVDGFLNDGDLLRVHSSNVASAQYHKEVQKMTIEFLNGGVYLYSEISRNDAEEFVIYASKGDFVWSELRVRGTACGHKKPYICIRKGITKTGRRNPCQ